MRWLSISVLAIPLLLGCERDKVILGRKLMNTEPERAVEVLREAASERSPCFECLAYLGLALEKSGRLMEAIEAYEAALPEAKGKTEPVANRLLDAYEKAFEVAKTREEKTEIAKKAAQLEVRLSSGRPWANRYLADELRRQIKEKRGDPAEVKRLAEAAQALYLPKETKREIAMEATNALQEAFVKKATDAFMNSLAVELAEMGRYEPDGRLVHLTNRFVIPSPKEDANFDPEASGFKINLRKAACNPLRSQLADLLGKVAPAIGLKALDDRAIDTLFARYFEHSKAGFASHGDDRRPAGRTWLCMIEVPLEHFLGELFRFAE